MLGGGGLYDTVVVVEVGETKDSGLLVMKEPGSDV